MLFLCYGITANANASHVAFAIICGGSFGLELHPYLDSVDITPGQGQKNRLPSMYNRLVTYCSFHRRQNIIKMCGGGSGKTANSALWMYKNKLMHCWLWHTKEIKYLNSLSDKSQYLAARCAMADEIYMHHCSSPSAVESMNKVNKEMRTRRDVEPLVATSLLKIDSANRSRRPGVEILS